MAEIVAKLKGLNKNEKTLFLKTLSAEEFLRYQRFRNNERQKKYKENPENKALANERSRLIMFVKREENPDKYKELNRKHNKDLNARKKASAVLTNAIKTRNAKRELLKKALEKANKTAKELDTNQQKSQATIKKGQEIMKNKQEEAIKKAKKTAKELEGTQKKAKAIIKEAKKAQVEPVRKYNTRAKA